MKQPTREELAARHHQTEVPANIPAAPIGLPLPGVSGPNGIRQVPRPSSTSWDGTLKGL